MDESLGNDKGHVRGQVRWNDRMDKILIDIFLEEYGFGSNANNSWKPEVYTRVCREIQKQLGQMVTSSNVKARIKTLKSNYKAAKEVISQSGFGWDPQTNMVTADALTWKEYLEVFFYYNFKIILFFSYGTN
jgi:hypothetical protein